MTERLNVGSGILSRRLGMNNKKNYKDLDKWRASCYRYRLKYYRRTQLAKNRNSPWTQKEVEIVMLHEIPDRVISEMIGRSVQAIQTLRCKENKKRCANNDTKGLDANLSQSAKPLVVAG